jgi:peptidoglycan hydrolase-like protein with peptidoglycan-binding domain
MVRFAMKRNLLIWAIILMTLFSVIQAQEAIPVPEEEDEEVVVVTSEGRALKYKDKGDDVVQLQTRLKDLRYYNGPVTGNYLEVTRKAVRAVQEAYGLEPTGDADLALQGIIYGDCHRPLAKGLTGKDVSRLQTRLSELGYYWGKISGNYLDGTTAAVGHFQEDNGLPKTGSADVKTLEKIYSDDIVMPTPDPNKPQTTPVPLATLSPEVTFKKPLSYGSKSNEVKMVQERLAALGFFDKKASSGFYRHTQASVKQFQTHNGLVPDGVVGEETWNAMFALDVVRADATPRPSPVPTPVPYFVEVDVNNQLIKVYKDDGQGGYSILEKIFTASTGTASFPSDVGTWTLSGRTARWAHFPTWGGGYAQYWTKINDGIAFHSFLYSSDRKRVNMGSVNKLGRPASHGCIRLTIQDAKWIYDNLGKGVQVYIHEDAPLDPELKYANRPGPFNSNTKMHDPTPAPTPVPYYDGSRPPAEPRNMKVGSEGEDVFWLQMKLKELGYYQGTVTGQYREGTKAAVKEYQKANKLGYSGNADKKTLAFLYEQTKLTTTPAPTPLPTDHPDGSPAVLTEPVPSATPEPVFTVEESP